MTEIPDEIMAKAREIEAPTLSDEWIASKWPDDDAGEIRRRFDALLDRLGESPWKGMPRWPDVMLPVLAWAALLPSDRIEILVETLSTVPDHLRDYKWVAEKPAFGEHRVKYGEVVGDNGHGMGRQAVAITPYVKGYNLAPWIAAASPGNVGALLAELERLRTALLSERTASEAALKDAREVIAKFADMIDGWVRPDPAVVGEAFVQLYDRCDEARAFLAKTGGA